MADQEFRRGRLKVFLGYASGVGKSMRMLDECRRRRERGQDVVAGAIQSNLPPDAAALLATFEQIPMLSVGGIVAMDVPAILKRQPQICLVDGLAYDNPPGSRNHQRWQDVEELVEAGISVITAINLQHIEEQRERVEAVTGKHIAETVPQRFLSNADEVVVVDAPPELLHEPAAEAVGPGIGQAARLSALREMALVFAADVVDEGFQRYLQVHNIAQPFSTQERIVVSLTPRTNAAPILLAAKRNAERFHCELLAVYVKERNLRKDDEVALVKNLELAKTACARVEVLEEADPIEAIVRFAREHGATQIFAGHSRARNFWTRLFGSSVSRLVRAAPEMDVRIFPH